MLAGLQAKLFEAQHYASERLCCIPLYAGVLLSAREVCHTCKLMGHSARNLDQDESMSDSKIFRFCLCKVGLMSKPEILQVS